MTFRQRLALVPTSCPQTRISEHSGLQETSTVIMGPDEDTRRNPALVLRVDPGSPLSLVLHETFKAKTITAETRGTPQDGEWPRTAYILQPHIAYYFSKMVYSFHQFHGHSPPGRTVSAYKGL